MHTPAKILARTCTFACIFFVATACQDTDDFFASDKTPSVTKEANTFDFSTSQEVDLIVDYSDFEANVPVFFSVYNVNPFVNENTTSEYIDENIKPIFSGYTGKDGKFDETVTLPAYAKRLHVVTGNFLVGLRRTMTTVENGEARMIVTNPMRETATRAAITRASGAGSPTTDLSQMTDLYKSFAGKQYYKEWLTPLGSWNSASGRPNYLLDKTDQTLINKGLVFSEEEFNGLYATACDALNSGTNMKEQYRQASDMTLATDSEVSLTALGSSTCWNSSLGYYYYTGTAPKNKMDLNIIMLFPNTQDGQWPRGKYPKNDYKGNIGNIRGDVVQLMYYPPKADGSLDLTKGTTIFPAGTKIGFILKCNSWGSRGADYSVNGSYSNKKNIWAATTDGLSSALDGGTCPNPNGEARSAKFSYTAPNGNQYAIVSFEDACDDKDYDDLMFALNPANAFDYGDFAKIESRLETVSSVYAFEDMWPEAGDYDMNDIVVECRHDMEFYQHGNNSSQNGLAREVFNLTTYRNSAAKVSGLGVRVTNDASVATIYASKIAKGSTTPATTDKMDNKKYYWLSEFNFIKENINNKENLFFYLTDNIAKELGATYTLEVTYSNSQSASKTNIELFIYRKEGGKYWEVHLPLKEPTSRVVSTYFGKSADCTDWNNKKNFYTRAGLYPFAFCLEGVSIDKFKETILQPGNESRPIDYFFPEFIEWSKSNGQTNKDWYLHPASE